MITPMASSLADARADYDDLQRIGVSGTHWSTKTLSGVVTEYVAFNDRTKHFEGGVKEAVVSFRADTDAPLTAKQATEVIRACAPRRDGPCHYIISAEGYSDHFADHIQELAGPEATVTLIDRSIMEGWNEDRRALNRLAVALHALDDAPPSSMFYYDITADPRDVDEVSVQFGRALYQICAMVAAYHGAIDIADGVEQNWSETPNDLHPDGQVTMALAAIDVAIGAIVGLFPELGVDPELTKQTLTALGAARNATVSASEPGPSGGQR